VTIKESEGMKSSGRAGGAAKLPFLDDAVDALDDKEDREAARRGYAETELSETELGGSERCAGAERTFLGAELSDTALVDISSDFKRASLTDSKTLAAVDRRLVDLIVES
jgi:hypothetical protein